MNKIPLTSRTLFSFHHEGWRVVVTALRNIEQNRSFIQLFTFLGHFPILDSDEQDSRREMLKYLVQKTRKVGRARVIVNDRKMIFLIIQSRINPALLKHDKDVVSESAVLMVEIVGILRLYRRYLSSR